MANVASWVSPLLSFTVNLDSNRLIPSLKLFLQITVEKGALVERIWSDHSYFILKKLDLSHSKSLVIVMD